MKYLFLISILLLSGCTQYQNPVRQTDYKGEYSKLKLDICYSRCDKLRQGCYDECYDTYISEYKGGVVEIIDGHNVCDFSYTRSEITK